MIRAETFFATGAIAEVNIQGLDGDPLVEQAQIRDRQEGQAATVGPVDIVNFSARG